MASGRPVIGVGEAAIGAGSFFCQAEDGIRDYKVTGVQTCALPVVFVTHDVDEAIKMADRIAILQRGGILAQYDTPRAILQGPAGEFVERFVGADRGLKRLSLARVADLPLMDPITAHAGAQRAELRRRLDTSGAAYALLLDANDRPVGWIGRHSLDRDGTVDSEDATPGSALLEMRSTLRDA